MRSYNGNSTYIFRLTDPSANLFLIVNELVTLTVLVNVSSSALESHQDYFRMFNL
jgi:hypothetical protein